MHSYTIRFTESLTGTAYIVCEILSDVSSDISFVVLTLGLTSADKPVSASLLL